MGCKTTGIASKINTCEFEAGIYSLAVRDELRDDWVRAQQVHRSLAHCQCAQCDRHAASNNLEF
ncbi:hypothetical protein IscW_ISCW005575 [Ixodes scapularis]|uniref:Uncharacterized protein n=1 Tax=Ixodes scapularis TaxID=6945 RepID=B7PLT3_IXOSC|nr:hypothetical protein IscW_ISCW005575 [Ixodes scapularis]|eukprot:XP_002434731.1 hypothetical protein IscW_ISCW005575 [Ixodes scapularis]